MAKCACQRELDALKARLAKNPDDEELVGIVEDLEREIPYTCDCAEYDTRREKYMDMER